MRLRSMLRHPGVTPYTLTYVGLATAATLAWLFLGANRTLVLLVIGSLVGELPRLHTTLTLISLRLKLTLGRYLKRKKVKYGVRQ